eukprot:PhM_4_TR15810/c0_g2_i1/m.87943/K13184/DHX9; ATP-dependent RNA helicase A
MACCQHAELLLDAVGMPFFWDSPSMQDKRAEEARRKGLWAPTSKGVQIRPQAVSPEPLLLLEEDISGSAMPAGSSPPEPTSDVSAIVVDMLPSDAGGGADDDELGSGKRMVAPAGLPEPDTEGPFKGFVVLRAACNAVGWFHIANPNELHRECRSRIATFCLEQSRPITFTYNTDAKGLFVASFILPLPKQFGVRTAIGVSQKKKDAEIACCQHAELILDAVGVKILSKAENQDRRAYETRRFGRWAPSSKCEPRPNVASPAPIVFLEGSVKEGDLSDASTTPDSSINLSEFKIIKRGSGLSEQYYVMNSDVLDRYCRVRLQEYLMSLPDGAGQVAFEKNAIGTKYHEVRLKLPVMDAKLAERELVARGVASRKKDAEMACCQHAEMILDTVGVQLYGFNPRRQKQRASATRKVGRWAPMPDDQLRPTAELPPPLHFVDEIDEKNAQSWSEEFISLETIGPDYHRAIVGFLQHDPPYQTSGILLGKDILIRARIKFMLPHGIGEKEAQGVARSKSIAIHLAYSHVWNIIVAHKANTDQPIIDAKTPPPLMYTLLNTATHTDDSFFASEQLRKALLVKTTPVLHPDNPDGYVVVRPFDHVKTCNENQTLALENPRAMDPHCLMRMRLCYQWLSNDTTSAELPIVLEEIGLQLRRATLVVKLPDPFPTITACAVARNNKDLLLLVAMHLELQLDAIGHPISPAATMQLQHAIAARTVGGRYAYMPGHEPSPPTPRPNVTPIPPLLREGVELILTQQPAFNPPAGLRVTSLVQPNVVGELPADVLPPADQVCMVDMFTLDRGLRAPVRAYLLRLGVSSAGSPLRWGVRDGYFHVHLTVPLPVASSENDPPRPESVSAWGIAPTKKDADHLCYMHAASLIRAYGVPLFKDAVEEKLFQTRSEALGREIGGLDTGSGIPPPFRLAHQARRQRPAELQHAEIMYTSSKRECKLVDERWTRYINDVEAYIKDNQKHHELALAFKEKSAFCGDPAVDDALVASEESQPDVHAKTILYNFCTRVGVEYPHFNFSRLEETGGERFFCSASLSGYSWIAKGNSISRETAGRRAAMHCIEILKRTHVEFDSQQDMSSRIKAAAIAAYKETTGVGSAALDGGMFTSTGYARLINMYALCNGLESPEMQHRTRRGGTGTVVHSCTITIREDSEVFKGTGEYGSRLLAEENAQEQLFNALRSAPKFNALMGLFRTHPQLDPNHVIPLEVPSTIESALSNVTELVQDVSVSSISVADATRNRNVKRSKRAYRKSTVSNDMKQLRARLPIAAARSKIIETIRANPVTVISATTGSGKTTQVPQYLLEDALERGKIDSSEVIVTQPRRITAISVANRVARERGESVGGVVGYSVRLESQPGSHLTYASTGVLLRIIESNPTLAGISHVIVDEVHERDMNADYVLLLLRRVLKDRPDLRVIVMSATLQSEQFSTFFGEAPVINVDAAVHPVDILHLEDIVPMAQKERVASALIRDYGAGKLTPHATRPIDYALLVFLIKHAAEAHNVKSNGSILVFLPGWSEIQHARDSIEGSGERTRFDIIMLHSSVSQEDQLRCFDKPAPGKTKVILSTNIAESGVTIDDVVVVIDVGKAREKRVVQQTDGTRTSTLSLLVTVAASKANCTQRKGRAGRTRKGYCYRLFTSSEFAELDEFQMPEILRTPLESLVLSMLYQRLGDPFAVLGNALTPPSTEQISHALTNLRHLGAIDNENKITHLGSTVARFPLPPSIAKMMIVGWVLGLLDTALNYAVSFDVGLFRSSQHAGRAEVDIIRSIFAENSNSDHYATINAYNQWASILHEHRDDPEVAKEKASRFASENNLHPQSLATFTLYKRQYHTLFVDLGFVKPPPPEQRKLFQQMQQLQYFRDLSVHSGNNNVDHGIDEIRQQHKHQNMHLVVGLLSAALFPNVAVHLKNGKFRTKVADTLRIRPGSVLQLLALESLQLQKKDLVSPFVVYAEKHGTAAGRGELHGVTLIGMWTLLLLGANTTHMSFRDDLNLCIIDDWIVTRMSQETYESIVHLKRGLDVLTSASSELDAGIRKNLQARVSRAISLLTGLDNMFGGSGSADQPHKLGESSSHLTVNKKEVLKHHPRAQTKIKDN